MTSSSLVYFYIMIEIDRKKLFKRNNINIIHTNPEPVRRFTGIKGIKSKDGVISFRLFLVFPFCCLLL